MCPEQIVVERAKWQDCWDEIKYCSDRCKSEAKRLKRRQHGEAPATGPVSAAP